MNSFVGILAFVVVLLVGVSSRHVDNDDYEQLPEADHIDSLNRVRDSVSQTRHRRRPRQMFGYDYQPPFYYDRRDYNHQQEEYLARIIKSLDEIIGYMRRNPPPPPPPQPVYIPYPVVHYQPTSCKPTSTPQPSKPGKPGKLPSTNGTIPSFGDRVLIMEDENQNWGQVAVELPEEEFEGDGSRPISFAPVEPSRPIKPPPPVDHGTSQVGVEQTTRQPIRYPGRCEAAILTCCSDKDLTERKNCFTKYGCVNTYATKKACEPEVVQQVLDHFTKAYAPDGSL